MSTPWRAADSIRKPSTNHVAIWANREAWNTYSATGGPLASLYNQKGKLNPKRSNRKTHEENRTKRPKRPVGRRAIRPRGGRLGAGGPPLRAGLRASALRRPREAGGRGRGARGETRGRRGGDVGLGSLVALDGPGGSRSSWWTFLEETSAFN